jgi:transcriptional regulator with XRE-family HTH domain
MPIISSISHPYWSDLGAAARQARTSYQLSQSKIATLVGLTVREYAALESGFIPPEIAEALGHLDLTRLDNALGWDEGTARGYVDKALRAITVPSATTGVLSFHGEAAIQGDRSVYPAAAWARLGKAVRATRLAEKLSRSELAYAMKSSSKTIMRLEEGRIYGDPRTAPPGDYNSERYILRRLVQLEFYLGWERDQAVRILEGQNRDDVSAAA